MTTLPALCQVSLISLAYFLCNENGLEQIVWPCPSRDEPVTLRDTTGEAMENHQQERDNMKFITLRFMVKITSLQFSVELCLVVPTASPHRNLIIVVPQSADSASITYHRSVSRDGVFWKGGHLLQSAIVCPILCYHGVKSSPPH